ncbi:MAG: histidine phosphatase family protein [bacterium]|nr:histidine phosphatase family protein [bacterium]
MELFFVRHGEDRAAAADCFGDTGLSERGQRQARDLSKRLCDLPFERCISSNLLRARETAEILLEGRRVEHAIDPDFAEGSVGDLEGLELSKARLRFPDDFRLGRSVAARLQAAGRTAPGGESAQEFEQRVRRAQARIERERQEVGSLLVVSHGGLLNALLRAILGLESAIPVPFGFDHCGVVKLLDYREEPGFGPFPMLRFPSMA